MLFRSETELNRNAEYRTWKAQYSRIQLQQLTVSRVEKALTELSKDNSVIDRSELAQRMRLLKKGLFGERGFINTHLGGKPPTLAWIEYTINEHNVTNSYFIDAITELKTDAWRYTKSGTGQATKINPNGSMYQDAKERIADTKSKKSLTTFSLTTLPVGSEDYTLACRKLEYAWSQRSEEHTSELQSH